MEHRNMTNAKELLEKCRNLGATLIASNDRIKVHAPVPLPDEIVDELKEAKPLIISELHRELRKEAECWLLEEWRRVSIPEWRKILKESIEKNDLKREEYARWMLREMLHDPEYKEEQ
jgi:hypothetical protein